jgi:hypothetical protein
VTEGELLQRVGGMDPVEEATGPPSTGLPRARRKVGGVDVTPANDEEAARPHTIGVFDGAKDHGVRWNTEMECGGGGGEGKSPPHESVRTTMSSRDDVSISNASKLKVT